MRRNLAGFDLECGFDAGGGSKSGGLESRQNVATIQSSPKVVLVYVARQLYRQISIGEMDEDTLFHHLPASILECHQGTVLASSEMELEE